MTLLRVWGGGPCVCRYASNNRPVLQYNADVDDDQGLRDLCDPKLHFATRTQRDYDPMRRSIEDKTEAAMHPKTWGTDGAAYAASKYASSRAARTQSSGFQVQFSHTLPKSKEVCFSLRHSYLWVLVSPPVF